MLRVMAAALLIAIGSGMAACAVPGPSDTVSYLRQAQAATRAHQSDAALSALAAAESAWLAGNAAASNPVVYHEHTALRNIGLARVSVQQERWGDADHYIGAALSDPSTLGQG